MNAAPSRWIRAAYLSDIEEGEVLGVEIEGTDVALCKVNGSVYATENVCTHAFARLSDGILDGYSIECPLHAGRFDVRTGKGLCEPITEDIRTFPVRIVRGEVHIQI